LTVAMVRVTGEDDVAKGWAARAGAAAAPTVARMEAVRKIRRVAVTVYTPLR